ncbi:ABC transporter ATP-binding protein [Chitiniphilus shinanonensis]|uniref:ABC transporter ATP-binding protein n=1 Tax=Chitiniphilus shinanonensis TaxID=553088 RepID=A0ABQ6BWF7_9NEIS|nr:ABC transporter ATP-binding protein [Chitiniphilus shinanonensis]GLS06300.1 ABC transporter ATP-binding protein [Chitiniphilus shinanonensis]
MNRTNETRQPPVGQAEPRAGSSRPAVIVHGVHKAYRSGTLDTPVLRGVDLSIETDQLSVLSGPSGSGKTTLLNLIGCIDRPDRGDLTVLGQQVGRLNDDQLSDFRRDHIGFVFQNFNLLPVLTAYENVEYPLLLARVPADERKRRVKAALDQVGLAAQMRHYPAQLSGGQRQRVAIARAFVKAPALILADEPTANLDSENGAAIVALMRALQRQHNVAFVISSHDPQLKAHADRVYPIRDGRLLPPETAPVRAETAAPSLV